MLFDYLRNIFYGKYDSELDISALDKDFTDVGDGLVFLAHCLSECNTLAKAVASGNLHTDLPKQQNELASSLKALHSSLKHLTWQTQQVAKGDYTQRVDYMGEFSEAFNTMTEQLREQRDKLMDWNNTLQETVKEKTKTVVELQNAILQTMSGLIDGRDTITGAHVERTQKYLAVLLEEVMRRDKYKEEASGWDLEFLLPSAQLHDVGKINVPDNILIKPGPLSHDEFEMIKMHTTFGEEVIERIKKNTTEHHFLEYARIFAISHHEKWNGMGYPKGLSGEDIPLLGRILAIADVYDALVSERPYKKPFAHARAVEIIQGDAGTHFDPGIVDVFLAVEKEFEEITKVLSAGRL